MVKLLREFLQVFVPNAPKRINTAMLALIFKILVPYSNICN